MVTGEDYTMSDIADPCDDIDYILTCKEKYEDMPLIEDDADDYPLYVERLHPRKDYRRKPFWLRIRSNPVRANYHKGKRR